MGVFDKDLIQKDLSIEDRLRVKILERAEGIKWSLDRASSEGVMEFSRLTEVGSYGINDRTYVWCDRYDAFMDYLTVNLLAMQEEINQPPYMYHDGKIVCIDRITPFSKIEPTLRGIGGPIHVRVPIQYRLRSLARPFLHNEGFAFEVDFDITLARPVRREPFEWSRPGWMI